MDNDELHKRLLDHEDGWTERKPKDVSDEDICKTIVAFANSLPDNEAGILFIGVSDKGIPLGVDKTDEMQKKVRRLAEDRCYPPISLQHNCKVFEADGKSIVAVIVSGSDNRPHFRGYTFVRVGSESVRPTVDQYERLLASRSSVARAILFERQKDHQVVVQIVGSNRDRRMLCKVVDCGVHFATFHDLESAKEESAPLNQISVSRHSSSGCTQFTIDKRK
jgi:predicted HTH transcriptional regulator